MDFVLVDAEGSMNMEKIKTWRIVKTNMDEKIKDKVREIQYKYCGESVETKLYYAIKKEEDKIFELETKYKRAMKGWVESAKKFIELNSPTKPNKNNG